jgi:CheY-like chemotaxis protein
MSRVLVVDNDLGTRETYDAALRHAGYAVTLADSGGAAIAALSSGAKTHAMLLDLKLGDMTGYDVLRWMRTQGIVVPTAVMTAFHFEFDPDEAIALGAIAYADQPLWIDDVLALAESLSTPPSPLDSPERLHARVLAGDPGALECLDAVFLKAVPARLERMFPRGPWDFAVDAATDASLEYAAKPCEV